MGVSTSGVKENVDQLVKIGPDGHIYSVGNYEHIVTSELAFETLQVIRYPNSNPGGWSWILTHSGYRGSTPPIPTGDFDLTFDKAGTPHLFADYEVPETERRFFGVHKLDFTEKKATAVQRPSNIKRTTFIQHVWPFENDIFHMFVHDASGNARAWTEFFDAPEGYMKGSSGIGYSNMPPGSTYSFTDTAVDAEGRLLLLLSVETAGAAGTARTWKVLGQETPNRQNLSMDSLPVQDPALLQGIPTHLAVVGNDLFVGVNLNGHSGITYKIMHLPAVARESGEWQEALSVSGNGISVIPAGDSVAVFAGPGSELAPEAPPPGESADSYYKILRSSECQ